MCVYINLIILKKEVGACTTFLYSNITVLYSHRMIRKEFLHDILQIKLTT